MRKVAACALLLIGFAPQDEPDRSPTDLALSEDARWIVTANSTSDSASLVDLREGAVVAEVAVGRRPFGVAMQGARAVVTNWLSDSITLLEVGVPRLSVQATIPVGDEPRGVALRGDRAWVALAGEDAVAVVDLKEGRVVARIPVGDEPWHLALAPDGGPLAVGNALSGTVSVIDTAELKVLRTVPVGGRNLRHVAIDAAGEWAYVPHIGSERGLPPTRPNIERAGVLANRLSRVPLRGDGPAQTIALDQDGYATADLDGLALSPDGKSVAVTVAGTRDILVLGFPLPFDRKPADHIDPALYKDKTRFRRIHTRGRLLGMSWLPDGTSLAVADFLGNELQVVSLAKQDIDRVVRLGGPKEPSAARKGARIFYDASRSWHEWYSCHSCHTDGHTNGGVYDTFNDGKTGNPKKVLSLRGVSRTGPWTWHGWQKDFATSLQGSFTRTMARESLRPDELRSMQAFLATLDFVPSRGDPESEPARRGAALFKTKGCDACHVPPDYTSDEVALVGLESPDDAHKGFSPPPLRGVFNRGPWLHDGRAKSLEELFRTHHRPLKLGGRPDFTESELPDLLEFLKSL